MSEPIIRVAREADVPAVVAMLADDPLGVGREHPGDPAYFAAVDADPRQLLVVADAGGELQRNITLPNGRRTRARPRAHPSRSWKGSPQL